VLLLSWNAFRTGQEYQERKHVANNRLCALTKICRTLMDVAALSFPPPDSPASLLFALPLPAEEDFDGILITRMICGALCRLGTVILCTRFFQGSTRHKPPLRAKLARCETRPKNKRGETRRPSTAAVISCERHVHPHLLTSICHPYSTGPRIMLNHV
jgi:hypothetical protein